MSVLALTALSILLGVLATVFVGKYYFAKTVAKRLTPYLQFAAPVFRGIDPAVRKQLQVLHNGIPVEELSQVQFVIVNDGERAIRDCIEPLCLLLPKDVSVLDAGILHVHPQGRKVDIQLSDQPGPSPSVKFPFALLNKSEGFVVKLLLRGKVSRDDLRFTIVADDLPPTLSIERWWPRTSKGTGDWIYALATEFMPLVVGASGLYATYMFLRLRPDLVPIPWSTYKYSWSLIPLALGLLCSLLSVIVGLENCWLRLELFRMHRLTKGPRFPLPPTYRPSSDLLFRLDVEEMSSEGKPPPEEEKGGTAA